VYLSLSLLEQPAQDVPDAQEKGYLNCGGAPCCGRARRIVANQHGLIARLKASGHSTVDAEGTLRMYISACKHLEDHEQKVRTEGKAKKRETKKPRSS
jgi:hypothetical protein